MSSWIYFLGEATIGEIMKIGWTGQETPRIRITGVNKDQHTDERFVLLAAIRGARGTEKKIQAYFGPPIPRGTRTEYFAAKPELVDYILWLRTQHFVATDPDVTESMLPLEDVNHWFPNPQRRITLIPDEDHLFSNHLQLSGPLAGTAWNWMPDPLASYQDYFTPSDIVRRASRAMGDIDLDAASHFLANKALAEAGVHIGRYFTASNSAFDNPWTGRVWLNPPYGDYLPWFERIDHELTIGRVQQVCMLSPMWAFSTRQAQPYVAKAGALVVLSPTPKFKNPADPNATGSNQPHAIVYWGQRRRPFLDAFAEVGIPCRLEVNL